MLHVVNGDAALELLKQSPIPGTFLPWKDMLMEGPIPSDGGEIDLRARGEFLRANYGADPRKYRAAMRSLFTALAKAARGRDEVVLWFEEDFFCQIHLAYLLAHLPAPLRRKGRTSIICPDKPLAARLPAAFPKLLAGRLPLTRPLLDLSARVWKAYASDSPSGWEGFLQWSRAGDGFAPWPRLRAGLRAHLGRLPTAHGGPNALETALLRSLAAGPLDFAHFARKVWSEPLIKPLGLGDMQIARYALDLSAAPAPLLALEGARPAEGRAPDPKDWKLHLTEAGKARLAEALAPVSVETARGASANGAARRAKARGPSSRSHAAAKSKTAKPKPASATATRGRR